MTIRNHDAPDTEVGSPQPPPIRDEYDEGVPALLQGGKFNFSFAETR